MLHGLDIKERTAALDGADFGDTGGYEQIYGSARFSVDPRLAVNARIVDLQLAPADDKGLVHCRADFWLLQPVDPARSNGALLYHVVNRGRHDALKTFQLANPSNRPSTAEDFGDGLFMEQGYSFAAVGWQADVPEYGSEDRDLLTLDVPSIEGVTGPVACEIVVDAPTDLHSLGSRYHHPYEWSEPHTADATLNVRDEPYAVHEPLERGSWSFDHLPDGRAAIRYPAGFTPGRIYNLVYTGRDPSVMGLGFATTRDFVSFLKYESATAEDQPNPTSGAIDRVHAFGSSQSGRFLRHLLHQGFNEDECGRRAFDGLFVNVGGAGMGSFNHRFAQPSRHASAHVDTYYPTEQFPFLDDPQQDPLSDDHDGLLDLARATDTAPKVFYTNTSTEYWNRGASLTHTDILSQLDVKPADEVRIYHFASTQHGPGELPAGAHNDGAPLPANPVNFYFTYRALLQTLDAWVQHGVAPPANAHSTIAAGTLVRPDANSIGWPAIPQLPLAAHPRHPRRLDWGPHWAQGIIEHEPPGHGEFYPILLPKVDVDGNEISGIRMPEVAVPLGTFAGWRYRTDAMGAPWALAGLSGFWRPFALTQAEAESAGDPRQPLDTRYADVEDYVARCLAIAESLVQQRLLLSRDVPRIAERASLMYEWALSR